jgi:hypothetical protein
MDPAVADALAESRDPYGYAFEWPPPHWNQPEEIDAGEYGATPGVTPPPPPPPPPVKKIGPGGVVIEETAQPVPAATSRVDENLIELEPNAPTVQVSQPRAPSIGNMVDVEQGPRRAGPAVPLTFGTEAGVEGAPSAGFVDQGLAPSGGAPSWASWDPATFDPAGSIRVPSSWSPSGGPEDRRDAKPHQSEQEMIEAEYQRLRKEDPVKAAVYMADHRIAQENNAAAILADVERKNREAAERNLQQRIEAEQRAADLTKQLHADAMANANTKIIRDRRSSGRRLGDIFLGALGGLIQGRTGGPNMGLQLVMKALDDDVEDQKAEIANRREMLGMRRNFIADELARGRDLYQAQETYRLAALEGMKQDAITEANKFDPSGTQAIKRYQMVAQIEGEQRKAIDAYRKTQLDEAIKMADLQGKLLENATKKAKLAGIGMAAPKIPRAQILADTGLDPGRDMTDKELDKWLERKGKVGSIGAQVAETKSKQDDADAKVAARRVGAPGEFVNKDGKEFLAPPGPEGEKLRATKAAVDLLAQMRNEISRGIERHGGESDYFKSADWQRQKSRHALVVAAITKALQLGSLDEGSVKMAEQIAGGVDPTSFWRDARPGLDQMVNGMAAKLSKDMRSQSYTGQQYAPPNNSKRGEVPTDSLVDELHKGAQARNFGERHAGVIGAGGGIQSVNVAKLAGDGERFQYVNALAFAADSPNEEQRAKAIIALEDVIENAPTDATKAYATRVLAKVRTAKPGEIAAEAIQGGE